MLSPSNECGAWSAQIKQELRPEIAALSIALCVCIVVLLPPFAEARLLGGLPALDLHHYFIPAFVFLRDALQRGELPFWNPYQMAGTPFLATQQPAVLYPLWWPLTLLPTYVAVTAFSYFHFWLSGFFVVLYLRRIGVAMSAGFAAALAYMLSPPLIEATMNHAYGATFAWLPGVFWALHRLATLPGPRNASLLSAVLAMAMLSGYAQGFFYLLHVATAYGLFLSVRADREQRVAVLGWSVAAGGLALALAAVQFLPTWELARAGTRSLAGLSVWQAASAVRHGWAEILTEVSGGTGPQSLPLLTLPLLLVAMIARSGRAHALFFGALLVSIADFMRGADGLLYPIHFALPGGSLFRLPGRANFAFVFCGAILIGLGAAGLARFARGYGIPAVAVLALVAAAVALERGVAIEPWRAALHEARKARATGPARLAEFGQSLQGESRVFLDRGFNPHAPVKMGQLHGFGAVPDYEPLLPAAYRTWFDFGRKRAGSAEIWHGRLNVLPSPGARAVSPRNLDWLAVRYYSDLRIYPNPRAADALVARIGGRVSFERPVPVVERVSALPRTFVARTIRVLPDDDAVLSLIGRLQAQRTALLAAPDLAALSVDPSELPPGSPGEARIAHAGLNRVEVEAECSGSCLLVLHDLHYPGWSVSVDGRESTLLRANFLFRAVALGAGVHRVVFAYWPTGFTLGATLGVAALVCLGLLAWWPDRVAVEASQTARASAAHPADRSEG